MSSQEPTSILDTIDSPPDLRKLKQGQLPDLAKEKEFKELFVDEARIAVHLLHVNIVQVFDLGDINGQYFMAMEYVHGLDLSRLLSRARALGLFPIPLAL